LDASVCGLRRPYRKAGAGTTAGSGGALAPGSMLTERVLAAHAARPFDLGATESPEYLGRAVAALAADPGVMARTGRVLTVGGLARGYGFADVDGRRPPPFELPGD
jgi:hypothetical protein